LPSKEDYSNFALYQASQKAYEATFLKNFVAHALHPNQIAECSEKRTDSHPTLHQYLDSVSGQVNKITDKMIWNAHCRVVNLFANDGKNGAPFLNVRAFNPEVFASFGPGNMFWVSNKMSASWHRADTNPSMVRYSTAEYPLLHHVGPLEEIDEVTNTLLRKDLFGKVLPTGRPTKLPTAKKRKGQGMPGAAVRREREAASRGNWLVFPQHTQVRSPLPKFFKPHVATNDTAMSDAHRELQILEDLCNILPAEPAMHSPVELPQFGTLRAPSPQFEELFGSYGTGAADIDDLDALIQGSSIEQVEKVLSWRARLVSDHKRRLTQKWGDPPQMLDIAVHGMKQALAVAKTKGIRPTGNDYRKKLQIVEARERQQRSCPFQSSEDGAQTPTKTRDPANCSQLGQIQGRTAGISETLFGEVVWNADPPGHVALSPSEEATTNTHEDNGGGRVTTEIRCSQQLPTGPPKKKMKKAPAVVKQSTNKRSTKQKIIGSSRQKATKLSKQSSSHFSPKNPVDLEPLFSHPSGSTTLEQHQQLPPDAYFKRTSVDEKNVWRCGIKHALGNYYNAGDRKSCRGCNTSLSDNPKVVWMDFYMPSRTFYHQPAPDMDWRPFKPSDKARKSNRPCHNSIAKDAYWAAIGSGETRDDSQQIAIKTVIEYLKPKPPPEEPTPEPTPTPEPDLGPHPSGSTMMEHGQELPEGAYWAKKDRCEEHAWRCDVNHALGRYYLAGDKKSCPGCGSHKTGQGKRAEMDFYLPSAVIVRQEAPGLSRWKPRKPNKSDKAGVSKGAVSHNQMCSRAYYEIFAQSWEEEEALRRAIEQVDNELEAKQEDMVRKRKERDEKEEQAPEETDTEICHSHNDSANSSTAGSLKTGRYRANSRGGCTVRLVPKKRDIDDLLEEDDDVSEEDNDGLSEGDIDDLFEEKMDEGEMYESGHSRSAQSPGEDIGTSSADDESSGSDSE
jgi:hypothetical protein